ncbi:hypothetical protein DNFV4_00995 [Nitrospira tepida]|uniref:Uncharacterized protein n=1 Tax=Nitrospira tepida TaxID=2973512 RepID=A0AA86MX10_9BACT|nr:hypothetical protein [Nitrospira tepida]CAI4030567.1 hypothetical protein DNFV4_00995 [Nitrospira tepida]
MSQAPTQQPQASPSTDASLPDRLCTWCKVPMRKRLVAGGKFLHYTCPKCVFQHTVAWSQPEPGSHPPQTGTGH